VSVKAFVSDVVMANINRRRINWTDR